MNPYDRLDARKLLATYSRIAFRFGVDSDEAHAFRNEHADQREFQSFARLTNFLLIMLGHPEEGRR